MSKKDIKPLLPRLRFPEFEELGEWDEKIIQELFNLRKKPEKAIVFDKEKVITVKLHTNGVIKNKSTNTLTGGANYYRRSAGDFIFSKIDLLNGAFGLIPDELDGFYSSSDVPAYSFKNKESSFFFLNWLKSSYKNLRIERTGTSSTLKRVSIESFLNILILLPTLTEQQKIADCLSSLDELIIVESKKLEAYETHKKGLMQELFPAEGETVPGRRFREFRNKEEWEEADLNDITSIITDYVANGSFKSLKDNVIVTETKDYALYVRLTDLRAGLGHPSQKYVDEKSYQFLSKSALFGGDILIANIGANVGEVWLMPYIKRPATLAPNMIMIKLNANIESRFIFYYLESAIGQKRISSAIAGTGHPKLNKTDLKQVKVQLPTLHEQQKIAICLSSLDDLITVQSKKIEALKAHKQGLLQGLFLSAAEVAK